MSEYPEHDKLRAIKEESEAIGKFLDFGLPRMGLHLYELEDIEGDPFNGTRVFPTHRTIQSILAEYFDIDEEKLNAEKEQMLDKLRA